MKNIVYNFVLQKNDLSFLGLVGQACRKYSRIFIQLYKPKNNIDQGKEKIEKRVWQNALLNMSKSDVQDNAKTVFVIYFQNCGKNIPKKESHRKEASSYGIHGFKFCCPTILDLQFEQIIAFPIRISCGS